MKKSIVFLMLMLSVVLMSVVSCNKDEGTFDPPDKANTKSASISIDEDFIAQYAPWIGAKGLMPVNETDMMLKSNNNYNLTSCDYDGLTYTGAAFGSIVMDAVYEEDGLSCSEMDSIDYIEILSVGSGVDYSFGHPMNKDMEVGDEVDMSTTGLCGLYAAVCLNVHVQDRASAGSSTFTFKARKIDGTWLSGPYTYTITWTSCQIGLYWSFNIYGTGRGFMRIDVNDVMEVYANTSPSSGSFSVMIGDEIDVIVASKSSLSAYLNGGNTGLSGGPAATINDSGVVTAVWAGETIVGYLSTSPI